MKWKKTQRKLKEEEESKKREHVKRGNGNLLQKLSGGVDAPAFNIGRLWW